MSLVEQLKMCSTSTWPFIWLIATWICFIIIHTMSVCFLNLCMMLLHYISRFVSFSSSNIFHFFLFLFFFSTTRNLSNNYLAYYDICLQQTVHIIKQKFVGILHKILACCKRNTNYIFSCTHYEMWLRMEHRRTYQVFVGQWS